MQILLHQNYIVQNIISYCHNRLKLFCQGWKNLPNYIYKIKIIFNVIIEIIFNVIIRIIWIGFRFLLLLQVSISVQHLTSFVFVRNLVVVCSLMKTFSLVIMNKNVLLENYKITVGHHIRLLDLCIMAALNFSAYLLRFRIQKHQNSFTSFEEVDNMSKS